MSDSRTRCCAGKLPWHAGVGTIKADREVRAHRYLLYRNSSSLMRASAAAHMVAIPGTFTPAPRTASPANHHDSRCPLRTAAWIHTAGLRDGLSRQDPTGPNLPPMCKPPLRSSRLPPPSAEFLPPGGCRRVHLREVCARVGPDNPSCHPTLTG